MMDKTDSNGKNMRKQVYELTVEDLNISPVWEFALDEEGEPGQDEATVRSYRIEGLLNSSDGMFVVRAKFKLADGTEQTGYLTPGHEASDLGSVQPQIVTANGQVGFWMGSIKQDVLPLYTILGKTASQVFPIEFISDVPLDTGPLTGRIPAFLHLEDFRTQRVKEIR
jgi:hypothetical protein